MGRKDMTEATIDSLIELHRTFWNRELDEPIVNIDCANSKRFGFVPTLPPQWHDQDGLILSPEMLSPQAFQPEPFRVNDNHPLFGEVAFNTLCPYFRPPWLTGIVGCELQVSTGSQAVWPLPTLPENWHELDDLGYSPRRDWLDKLLEFIAYIVEHWYPGRCVPCLDMIGRGPGDLLNALLGPERFYMAMYKHPTQLKLLIEKVADEYIRWAKSQFEILPAFHGGACNLYGIWSPGECIRFQEDYAINISERHFMEFLMSSSMRIMKEFECQVYHTHSGFSNLSKWATEIDELKSVDVALDPNGSALRALFPHLNRILERKCLVIAGELTREQLDLLVSELSPGGLWIDVNIVESEVVATV